MIELLFGLVGLAVLISMLVQISVIGKEHTSMVVELRNEMANRLASGALPAQDAEYLSGWNAGNDLKNYTMDDRSELGNAVAFLDGMEAAMHLSELQSRLESPFPYNPYLNLNNSTAGGASEALGIFNLSAQTDEIEILPVIRRLVVDIESLVLKHEIYMPSIQNFMEGP